MPYTFNPFTGNFDNTPSTNKGDGAYTTLLSNSANFSTYNYVNSKFLPLSGGTVTGKVFLHDNLTVYGTISATGNSYFANTVYSTTSALSVINLGNNGPALYISNNGTGDLASFYDYDTNVEVFHIGGANGSFPNVGVKTSTPNVDFTVNGQISSNNIIFARDGNSNDWNSNYSLVQSKSANWDIDIDTGVRSLTGDYAVKSELVKYLPLSGGTVTGNVYLLSALEIGTGVDTLIVGDNFITANASISSNNIIFARDGNSNDWNSNYSLTQSKSASWDLAVTSGYTGTDIKELTGFWDASRTYVNSNSGSLNGIYTLTGNYASVYSQVNTNSANWNYQGTDIKELTGFWDSSRTYVNSNSGSLNGVYALTGNYASVYSQVNTNSANWQNTFLNQNKYLPLSGGIVTGTVSILSTLEIGTGVDTLIVGDNFITANASISSNSIIFAKGGDSDKWNSNYSLTQSKSASWDLGLASSYTGADIKALTGNYTSVYSTVNTNSANYILDGGNTKSSNLLIGTNDNFNLALETNNTPRLTIFNNGNIGINESSPEGRLHVTAGSAGTVVAQTSSVGVFESSGHAYISLLSPTSRFAGVVMGGPTNSYGSYLSWNHDNLALKLATNHTGAFIQMLAGTEQEAMRITSTLNVGIGSTNPNEKLTVVGNISASGRLLGDGSQLTGIVDSGVRGLTGNYNSVFSTVSTNSARWVLEDFIVACSDEATNLTTSISAVTFRVPYAMFLNSIRASVNVAPVGSTIIVDVKQTGTSIFSTKLSIDANEETSTTAATPAVISNPNLTDDAKIVVSIDQVGSSTAGRGLKLTFKGYRV